MERGRVGATKAWFGLRFGTLPCEYPGMGLSHSSKYRSSVAAALCGLITLGVILRLFQLSRGLVWTDEVFALLRISGKGLTQFVAEMYQGQAVSTAQLLGYQTVGLQSTFTGVLSGLRLEELEQAPLFTILSHYAGSLGLPAVLSIRLVSAMASVLTIAVSGCLAFALVRDRRAALVTAAVVACSPLQVLYAREGRCYALWTLFTLLSTWMLDRATQRNRFRDWAGYAGANILSLYTHPLTLLLLPGHALYVVLASRKNRGLWVPGALSLGAAVAAFVPWLLPTLAARDLVCADHTGDRLSTVRYLTVVARGLFALLARSLSELLPYGENWNSSWRYQFQSAIWVGLAASVVALLTLSMLVRRDRSRLSILLLPALTMVGGLILIDLVTGTDRGQVHRYYLPCITQILVLLGIIIVQPKEESAAPMRLSRALDRLQCLLRVVRFPTVLLLCGLFSSTVQNLVAVNWLNGSSDYAISFAAALWMPHRADKPPLVRACQVSPMVVLPLAHRVDSRTTWKLTGKPCQLGVGDTHVLSTRAFEEYGTDVQERLRLQVVASLADKQLARISD